MNNLEKQMKANEPLSQEAQDVLIGTLLGDAWMRFVGKTSAFYGFSQSLSHGSYFHHVLGFFSHIVNAESKQEFLRNKPDGKTYTTLAFRTFTLEVLYPYATMFYNVDPDTGKYVKFVPSNISELLTPRALAFWIMDDGFKVKRGGVTLCTDSFTPEHVQLLKSVLESKFGLMCTVQKKNRIYISGKSLHKLTSIVGQYMHPSFMYKLSDK
jgi:ubiquinol-cytochrome c reductase cytochrome b subunit